MNKDFFDIIIAELTLGFWTIKTIEKGLEKMRLLRNRVSHYERLIHWKDLQTQHLQIIENIKFLNNESYELAIKIDSFDDVYSKGIVPFEVLVKQNWN